LEISDRVSIDVGEKLHIWGFPDGYGGHNPLLTVGRLSGVDAGRRNEPMGSVVNAPFQSETSGGPIVDANDGLIVGVVSGRINYFPPYLTEVLKSLKSVSAGGKYPVPADDGSTVLLTETQVNRRDPGGAEGRARSFAGPRSCRNGSASILNE
jgi:hypothetical protein